MYLIVDANRVPVFDAGSPVEGVTLDEAAAFLTRYPEGQIIDTETGALVPPPDFDGPSSISLHPAAEACTP